MISMMSIMMLKMGMLVNLERFNQVMARSLVVMMRMMMMLMMML